MLTLCTLIRLGENVRFLFILPALFLCRYIIIIRAGLSNSYTMSCPPVRGDNPRALASG